MRALAAVFAVIAFFVLSAGAGAQGGSPFGPLPPTPPPTPAPQPAPADPDDAQADDDELGTVELLGLAGIAVLLFAGVAVGITREGGRLGRRSARGEGRSRRGRRSRPPRGKPPPSKAPASKGPTTKAPPPPPRKRRRQKSKRR